MLSEAPGAIFAVTRIHLQEALNKSTLLEEPNAGPDSCMQDMKGDEAGSTSRHGHYQYRVLRAATAFIDATGGLVAF